METENKPEEEVTEPSPSNVPAQKTEIEPFEGKKQWLGGFKHKVNNIGRVLTAELIFLFMFFRVPQRRSANKPKSSSSCC